MAAPDLICSPAPRLHCPLFGDDGEAQRGARCAVLVCSCDRVLSRRAHIWVFADSDFARAWTKRNPFGERRLDGILHVLDLFHAVICSQSMKCQRKFLSCSV